MNYKKDKGDSSGWSGRSLELFGNVAMFPWCPDWITRWQMIKNICKWLVSCVSSNQGLIKPALEPSPAVRELDASLVFCPTQPIHSQCWNVATDTIFQNYRYTEIQRDFSGSQRLNQYWVISIGKGLFLTDVYLYVKVLHSRFEWKTFVHLILSMHVLLFQWDQLSCLLTFPLCLQSLPTVFFFFFFCPHQEPILHSAEIRITNHCMKLHTVPVSLFFTLEREMTPGKQGRPRWIIPG